MPRIVGGWAGSLQLSAPAGPTRPTSDRVREAVFSALESRDVLDGARVLDLYAGSGALGLEAVSRGAESAVLVDRDARAVRAMRDNVTRLRRAASATGRPAPAVQVSSRSARAHLVHAGDAARPATLVFLDPPYDLDAADLVVDLDLLHDRLADGATVVVERSARTPEPEWPGWLELDRSRTYGDTVVFTLTASVPAAGSDEGVPAGGS